MGWLSSWRMNRAAKQYARSIRPWLQRSFGASDRYRAAQVRAAVKALKLESSFIGLAYAFFLSEEEFNTLRAEMPVQVGYENARALFARYLPSQPFSASGEAIENDYARIGASSEHHS